MIGNKFEKSHIHILEPETLSREYRVTESAQEIVDSIICNCEQYTYVYHMSTPIHSLCRRIIYKNMGILLGVVSVILLFLVSVWCQFQKQTAYFLLRHLTTQTL